MINPIVIFGNALMLVGRFLCPSIKFGGIGPDPTDNVLKAHS
jgi:hypothetical protein